MDNFKEFVGIMAYGSLGFTVVAAYLKINKIWTGTDKLTAADR